MAGAILLILLSALIGSGVTLFAVLLDKRERNAK